MVIASEAKQSWKREEDCFPEGMLRDRRKEHFS